MHNALCNAIDARFGGANCKYEDYPCGWDQREGTFTLILVVAWNLEMKTSLEVQFGYRNTDYYVDSSLWPLIVRYKSGLSGFEFLILCLCHC